MYQSNVTLHQSHWLYIDKTGHPLTFAHTLLDRKKRNYVCDKNSMF